MQAPPPSPVHLSHLMLLHSIFMELLSGVEFRDVVVARKQKPLPEELLKSWVRQIASALQHLHEDGNLVSFMPFSLCGIGSDIATFPPPIGAPGLAQRQRHDHAPRALRLCF